MQVACQEAQNTEAQYESYGQKHTYIHIKTTQLKLR